MEIRELQPSGYLYDIKIVNLDLEGAYKNGWGITDMGLRGVNFTSQMRIVLIINKKKIPCEIVQKMRWDSISPNPQPFDSSQSHSYRDFG